MRRRLLFVSPVLPAGTGFGLAMRAGLFLDALSTIFDVFVLVVPVVDDLSFPSAKSFTADRARNVAFAGSSSDRVADALAWLSDPEQRMRTAGSYPLPRLMRAAAGMQIGEALTILGATEFSAVHVMRQYLAPIAEQWLGRIHSFLDLDDDEVGTHLSLSRLYERLGEPALAADESDEAAAYRRAEKVQLGRFDAVSVCSEDDAAEVSRRCPEAHLHIVPNGVPEPVLTTPKAAPRDVLFVGNLTYAPNVDGASFLCHDTLPLLSAKLGRQATVTIAGHADASARALGELPGVRVVGFVNDVSPMYADHRIVALPLRAGGGTSIKAIEAFAHRRPCVATSVAVRGLGIESGAHALVAEDPNGFAGAFAQILRDPSAADAMAARANQLFVEKFRADDIKCSIIRLYETVAASSQT